MSYLATSKRAHHHRVHVSTSCYTRHTPMHASTALVRVAGKQLFFKGRTSETCLVLCPRLPSSVLCCCSKYVMYPTHIKTFLCKAPFACFEQLHLPHSDDLPARPRDICPKNGRGGVCCVAFFFFFFFFFSRRGAIYSVFCPFSLKLAPRGV